MMSILVAALMMWSTMGPALAPPEQGPVVTLLGPKAYRNGDVIEIRDVQATSAKLEQGDSITVRGRFRLQSEDDAELSLYVTQTRSPVATPVDPGQTIRVEKGTGEFELKTTITHRGALHVSFYSTESGQGFGGVYFGTREQMKRIAGWKVGTSVEGEK
jgi:hypothetical protein